jgi:hypothetical protein
MLLKVKAFVQTNAVIITVVLLAVIGYYGFKRGGFLRKRR